MAEALVLGTSQCQFESDPEYHAEEAITDLVSDCKSDAHAQVGSIPTLSTNFQSS